MATPQLAEDEKLAVIGTRESAVDDANEKGLSRTGSDEQIVSSPDYPSGFRLAAIIVGLQLAILCVALDNTIITTAIPRITDDFKALDDVGWYASAYLLPLAAFQLFFGRLYSTLNIKWTFLISLTIFEIGSLICAVAPNSTALIVGRAIAGLGSAGLFSGALIIIALQTPLEKRAIYIGLVISMYGVSSVVGPLLGGVFTDHVTWRWCFYINLPLGGATIAALFFFLRLPPTSETAAEVTGQDKSWWSIIARFDPIGTLLFTPSIVCVLLALQWGGTQYPWSDSRVIALFVVFGVLLLAFCAVQVWMGENATVPLRIMKNRDIAFGFWFSMCVGAGFFIMIFYLPIWFQSVQGKSAQQSGIDLLPMMIALILGSMVSGFIIFLCGYYTPFFYALVVSSGIGAGLIYTLSPDTTTGQWIGYQILFGLGIGLGMQLTLVAAQTCLKSVSDISTGVALMMFANMFGGALFVSVAQTAFTNRLVSELAVVAPGLDPRTLIAAGATSIVSSISDPNALRQVQEIASAALSQTFLIATIMICLALLGALGMRWHNVKGMMVAAAI